MRLSALLLGKYDRAAELGVTLVLDPLSALPPQLPAPTLDLLELAAGNLIENACEAASGTADAQVRVLIAGDPEGLIVEVRDTGPGLPAGLDPIRRGSSSKGTGRGVGLALVHDRAAAQGAALSWDRVCDPDGRPWTRFTLDLPAGAAP